MKTYIYPTEELPKQAGQFLSQIFNSYAERPILFLASGGSALKLLSFVSVEKKVYENLTVSVLDSRYEVSDSDSNFFQVIQTDFYKQGLHHGIKVIDPRKLDGEPLDKTAIRFDDALRNWRKANPGGLIIATQGVGSDNHTAGVLPIDDPIRFTDLFVDTDKFAAGYHVDPSINKFTDRITTTISFLKNEVDHSLVYLSGEDKRSVLEHLEQEQPLFQKPAAVIPEMQDVHIFTDVV